MEPINVPHHIIPGSPPPAPPATSTGVEGRAAGAVTSTAEEVLRHTLVLHTKGGLFPVLAITSLILGSIALAVLLLRTVRATVIQETLAGKPCMSGLGGYGYYVYQGLKAVLREIFTEFKEKVSTMLGTPLETATPREVAEALSDDRALEFARRYEALMYGPREPGDNEVSELESAARSILETLKGREHG
jgi:hypothetical protein